MSSAPARPTKRRIAAFFVIGLIVGLVIGLPIAGYIILPRVVKPKVKVKVVEKPVPPKPIEVTLAYPVWWGDYWYIRDIIIPQFEGYMLRKGKFVRIKIVEYPSPDEPYRDKLIADMKAGTAPDILAVDSFWVPALAAAGYLLDITDYTAKWEDWKYFYKPMKDMVSWKGRVYAVMMGTDVRPLYYRKDIFIAAGIIKPGEKWVPKTLDEVLEAARKIKKWAREHGYEIYPIALKAGVLAGEACTMQGFYMILLGYGGRLYDFKTGKWIAKSRALLKTLEFYYKIYIEEKLSVPPEFWLTGKPVDKIHEYLRDGKLAIFITWDGVWYDTGPGGKWEIKTDFRGRPATRDEVLDYTITPGEKPGMVVTISGGWSWAIYAKAKERGTAEIAWEFLKFVASRKIKVLHLVSVAPGSLAPRKDVAEDPVYRARVDKYTIWRATTLVPHTTFRPGLPEYMKVSELVQKATELILRGKKPREVLEWYATELKKIVGADKVIEYPIE